MNTEELERNKTIQIADVFKAGRRAAQLRRSDQGTEFVYFPDYLNDGIPVATTLPLTTTPLLTTAGAVPPFFAGLLPEGRRLTSLRRHVKTSANDELSLLLAVGRDPVGNVQVVPEGELPGEQESLLVVTQSFSEIHFSELMVEAGVVDLVSIPGVQDKVSARMISVPLRSAGTRYILKLDPPEYPHLIENEYFFLSMAAASGMPTVRAELVEDVDGRKGLLIQRFDRVSLPGGKTRSLACEDACQLLNLWPSDKYNVTSERLIGAIQSVCTAGIVAARDVFRQLCFAWLTGNGDVHAKNVSVLADFEGEWSVAPAYDLPSTVPYGDLTLALSIGGKTKDLSRRGMLDFANAIGLNEKAASSALDGVLERTAGVVEKLSGGVIPFDPHTVSEMVRTLRYRRHQMTSHG